MSYFLNAVLNWPQEPPPPVITTQLEIHHCNLHGSNDTVFKLYDYQAIARRSTQLCALSVLRALFENDDIAILITMWLRKIHREIQMQLFDTIGFGQMVEKCLSIDKYRARYYAYNNKVTVVDCLEQIKNLFTDHANNNDGTTTMHTMTINISHLYPLLLMPVLLTALLLNIPSIGITVDSHITEALFDACFEQLNRMECFIERSRDGATLLWLNDTSFLRMVDCHLCVKESPPPSSNCLQQ